MSELSDEKNRQIKKIFWGIWDSWRNGWNSIYCSKKTGDKNLNVDGERSANYCEQDYFKKKGVPDTVNNSSK